MIAKQKEVCAACGPAQASHTALWLANSSDTLTLSLPWGALAESLAGAGNRLTSLIGHAAFHVSRAAGLITLSDDIERAHSNRSRLLWLEARRRAIPMQQLLFLGRPTDSFLIRIDNRNHFFKSIPLLPTDDSALRMDDKVWFKKRMRAAGLPVPESRAIFNERDGLTALSDFGIVCVKPRTGSNGRHTYPFVRTSKDLTDALKSVKEICISASVEEQLEGNLCRATCVAGKLVGFLESGYPTVVGDGSSTVAELVTAMNASRAAGVAEVILTDSHVGYIKRRGYALDSVLPAGVKLPLTYRAGYGQGGWNREYGHAIHPSFIPIIEEAARLTGLSVVGFDLVIPEAEASADSQRWGFIEANSLPWIDLHAAPFYGDPIDVAPFVWDMWKSAA